MKADQLRSGTLWKIIIHENDISAQNSDGERVAIDGTDALDLSHGDIIEVLTDNRVVRLHNGKSSSALIYITNQCNSNCIMCPDSETARQKQNTITKQFLLDYVSLLPSDLLHIDITGGEPTLLKEGLVEVIASTFKVVETAEVQVLTNGRSFADEKYTMQFEPFSKNRLYIEIPIHAGEGKLHDKIAGIRGAFDQTYKGIKLLQRYKIPVGIRVVVQKLNIWHLTDIIDMIANHYPNIMYIDFLGLEVMGNAFKNKDDVWIEFDDVKHFLENAVEHCLYRGIEPRLFNYPLCLFEKKYWYCYKNSITDHKIRYMDACETCPMINRCGGFFSTTIHNTTFQARPIK